MSVVDEAALNCCLESGCVVLGCLPSGPRENLGLPIHLLVISWQHGRTFLIPRWNMGSWAARPFFPRPALHTKWMSELET